MNNSDAIDHSNEIAIIGMACRLPGARNVAEFWQNLQAGTESISFFSNEELVSAGVDPTLVMAPNYVKAGAVLEDIDLFDAAFFGLTPREAEIMDPQHRIFLECAWETLEHAGYNPDTYRGKIGIYAGVGVNTYLSPAQYDTASPSDLFQSAIGNEKEHLATHTSYKLNLKGPSISVSTACSTSLVAIHMACQSLLNGECDMFLAGGVSIRATQRAGYFYQMEGIASPDGHCRAFDAKALGTVPGNGVGVVALKRLDDALADGDCIHAVIKGSALNNDGSLKIGYTAPSVQGQAEVISEAQAVAGIEPEEISYIETHGTGTPLGDTIEITALTRVFSTRTQKKGFCAIGSVKTNIGHLDTASGVTSLIKTVLALKYRLLPPSLHFEHPNPAIDFTNSPFYVNTALTEWKRGHAPRRAGVSSFGLGGTNVHMILEEAPAAVEKDAATRPWQLVSLSARTASSLDTMTHNLAAYLKEHPYLNLADVAYTLQIGRKAFDHRQVAVCRTINDAIHVLETADSARTFRASQQASHRALAFLFPGVGDHYVHMAWGLYQAEPHFRKHVDHCAELLKPHLGLDLRDVLYPGTWRNPEKALASDASSASPVQKLDLRQMLRRETESPDAATRLLNETRLVQPALFVIEYAVARLWIEWIGKPDAMIGYSLGEYVAACLAGVMSLEHALFLVARRARLIDTLPAGAMLAIPLPESAVRTLLDAHLSIAAVNTPSLCVVSGPVSAIEALEQKLSQQEISCQRVQTSHAFHSKMMAPIVDSFVALFSAITMKAPTIPYLSNVTGTWITAEQATDPTYWAKHMCQEVRLADCVHELFSASNPILLEAGPGQAVSSLVLQSTENTAHSDRIAFPSLRYTFDSQPDMAFLLNTLGRLWLTGIAVDWPRFYAKEQRLHIPLPTYPFERQRYWIAAQKQTTSLPAMPNSQAKRSNVADWFYLPSWKRSLPLSPLNASIAQKQYWLVFVDEWGIGSQIVKRLEEEGQDVVTVSIGDTFTRREDKKYTLHPHERNGYNALLKDLDATQRIPGIIVHCWSITATEAHLHPSIKLFQEAQHSGFYSLIFLAQLFGQHSVTDPLQIRVLSNHIHDLERGDTIDPLKAPLLSPCKVIPQEYPNITCQCIDITLPEVGSQEEELLLTQLIGTLHEPLRDAMIAYRGRHRWVQTFETLPLAKSEQPALLRPKGVYMIVGGLGAIGFSLARWLAQSMQARLVLVGRAELPPQEDWPYWLTTHNKNNNISIRIQRMQELEALGAEVLAMSADATQVTQMQAVIDHTLQRFNTINGVIYAAGVESEKNLWPIQELEYSACELHFQPKVYGSLVLEEVLSRCKIDFCLLLSSLSSILGGLQFTPYAAANMFLDAYVHYHNRGKHTPWISVDWDGAATPEETVDAMQRILSLKAIEQVVVSTRDLYPRLDQWIVPKLFQQEEKENGKSEQTISTHYPRPHLQNAYIAPENELEQLLVDIWQTMLGIEQVGIHDNFFMLGGHSLLATQIVTRLRKVLQVELPLRAFLETPTIAELALAVAQIQAEQVENDTHIPSFPPLIHLARGQDLPLSFAQQRLWFLDQLEPGSAAYSIPAVLLLTGALNIQVLEKSLEEIMQRHEILRTTFDLKDGQPIQIIEEVKKVCIPLVDLSELFLETREAEMHRLQLQQLQQPFDLAHGPLLRTTLLRLSEQKHAMSFVINHIVTDGWSIGVLVRELSAFYQAVMNGEHPTLPDLPIQYADYALWQRQRLQGEVLDEQLAYWRKQLANLTPLELPMDHPRPVTRTYRGALQSRLLPPAVSKGVLALSQQQDVTLFMVLLATFQVLLMRYTRQADLSVGTPIANRTHVELEGLIGFFVNTLVLRTDLSGNPTFEELLHKVREVCLEAYAHQDIPFEKVVEELSPERDMSHSPLFQVMFVLQNNALEHYEPLPGVNIDPLTPVGVGFAPVLTSKFDLTLSLVQTDQGLHTILEYSTDLFEADTIRRMLGHWQMLLEGVVHNPQARLSDLPLLPYSEQEQLLIQPDVTTADNPGKLCLHQLFEQQAEQAPDSIAVVFEEQQITYHQLNEQANRLAHRLLEEGVGPDQLVGVWMERSLELMVALLAVLKAGGAYVPFDDQLPQARLIALFEDAQLSIVLTQTHLKSPVEQAHSLSASRILFICLDEDLTALRPLRGNIGNVRRGVTLRAPWCADEFSKNPARQLSSENLAYMIYTSGSTGKPKGVMVTHANITRLLTTTNAGFHFQAQDIWTFFHSSAFDFSVWEIWGSLLYGSRLVVVPYWLSRSPEEFYQLLIAEQVTILNQTPSAFRQLIEVDLRGEEHVDLALRLIIFGGEALDFRSLLPWFDRHGDQHPQIINMYGITETTVHVTCYPLTLADVQIYHGSSIGGPLADLQCYVLDGYGQLVPIGVPGELHIGGMGLARGYWQRADITAERFIPHPFNQEPGARLYRTGDLVRYQTTGTLEYLGRIDQQVKLRGFRVELGEIEATLMKHPAVRSAVVLAREDGSGEKRLVAYVVREESTPVQMGELRSYLQEQLPTYMVPAFIVFLSALPLSTNGKIDSKALPAPRQEEEAATERREKTPIEELISGVYALVLGHTQVGIHDNFFDLGGHSLLATQVVSRIRTLFHVEIPLRTLFEAPTVAQLAVSIKQTLLQKQGLELPPLLAVSRNQPLPLSFAQQRLWLLDQIESDLATYMMPMAVRLRGQLHIHILQRCFQEIIQRHECLRTVFSEQPGNPLQIQQPFLLFTLPAIDLHSIDVQQRQNTIIHLVEEETASPFDLSKGPLIRGKLLLLDTQEYVLIITMHHITTDAWSLGVMVRELATLYDAFLQQKPSPLPPLPVQYADFAVWQHNWLQGKVLETLLTYWKKQLRGAAPLLLPTDRPASLATSSRGAIHTFSLPADLTQALVVLSHQEQATLFMTLLAAFQTLLYRHTGQTDSVIGTDIAGRVHEEVENLIGFFVNLLVLRTDMSGNSSFRELVQRVREMVLDAYAHQDLPFEKLVDGLQLARSHRQTPLVRALFVLQNAPMPPLDLPGITMQPLDIDPHTAKFDLATFMWEEAGTLVGMLNYRVDLFDASTIETLAARFITLLQAIIAQPDTTLDTFTIFTEEEIQQKKQNDAMEYEDHRRKLKISKRKDIVFTQSTSS